MRDENRSLGAVRHAPLVAAPAAARGPQLWITDPELEDLAYWAANALMAIVRVRKQIYAAGPTAVTRATVSCPQ